MLKFQLNTSKVLSRYFSFRGAVFGRYSFRGCVEAAQKNGGGTAPKTAAFKHLVWVFFLIVKALFGGFFRT